jgi:hypothetical protein
MHYTQDGRFISEADCRAWFKRLCKCGHDYGIHIYGGCHRQDDNGKFCPCREFRKAAK